MFSIRKNDRYTNTETSDQDIGKLKKTARSGDGEIAIPSFPTQTNEIEREHPRRDGVQSHI